jgi:D-lyxose ketol-isomerase
MKKEIAEQARERAARMLRTAGIVITPAERAAIEVADFGLNDFGHYGLEIVIYENNDLYCAKELILFPRQICPEHLHPPVEGRHSGKQETFRCRWGEVYLNVQGPATPHPRARIPEGHESFFSVRREIVLRPGEQYTLLPNSLHWFQAGDEGAIVSEFSTTNTDDVDRFTDPKIKRMPVIE